jgi:hypothetical protein
MKGATHLSRKRLGAGARNGKHGVPGRFQVASSSLRKSGWWGRRNLGGLGNGWGRRRVARTRLEWPRRIMKPTKLEGATHHVVPTATSLHPIPAI